ncbi:PEP-CTERM sorting domain-containing protein [Alkalimonas delamerensis]|uniref:PEP-CTERM sorting domain-containing protein n=1 Tax=Alkalimonas delamerensis TaxID=265981 RepID=A0ABT9GLW6_9GAMM|nr:PEP-CTERM sorting domain-containing protein [Alkalimonas delamerensis]MDP4527961.1 PEP-CTERM sorting domain-containing protein [Alkalimonas delamerensis]
MKLKPLFTTALTLGLLASSAHATIIDYQSGTRFEVQQVIEFSTGADLHGMNVTACFLDLSCQTVSFNGTLEDPIDGDADVYGAAIGDGWKLSLAGDSFLNDFVFNTTVAVTKLHLNGASGNTVFDAKYIESDTASGTPGSQRGAYFTHISGIEPTEVVYSNEVWFNGNFYYDLYTSMSIYFGLEGATGEMVFFTDTDQARGLQVPAPATLLLMLAGLAALRQRKSRK